MKEMKRILSFVLCFAMLFGMLPVGALAAEQETSAPQTVVEEAVSGATEVQTVPATTEGETTPPTTMATEPEVIAVTGIALDITYLETEVGAEPVTLTATVTPENAADKTVTWTSSEPGVASVADGVVTFGYMGEAVITAAAGESTAECHVVVVEGDTSVYVDNRASSNMLTAAIFFSDVHEESTGTSGSGTSAMKSVLSTIGANGVSYETIGLVGDTYTDKAGTMANMTSAAQGALGQTIPCYYAYGDHDEESDISPDSGLMYTGNHYYIYHISDANMRSKVESQSEIDYATAIKNFKNDVASMDKSKVLFIMSHAPLHDRRDDNTYANSWYAAIEEVAATMDVVFFWAHNHTDENDVDRAAYYVAKDGSETFTVYNGDTVKPGFTYMNAGYIYAAGQNPSRKGVATTVEIYDDYMVFQDYNSSDVYTDSTYSHNVTVAREFAASEPTLSSIAISGDTEYFVGDELALTVTATYSDGTTADVTADATLSGYDMSAAGTQTVTATYEGLTATTQITVNAVLVNSIAVTTQPTKLTYTTGEELDTTGMVVTATYNNGTTAEVTGWYTSAVDMTTAGEKTVTVNYAVDGITYKTTFTITVEEGVAEGVTLTSIEVTTPPTKTEYLLSEELKLDGMVVVATFSDGSTKEIEYKPFSTSTVYGGYELDNFSMYVEKAHKVKVTYTFGEVTCTATTTINVWNEDFADEATGVTVHVTGDYGVTAAAVSTLEQDTVAEFISDVISGTSYVAYDIELTFDEGYSETETTKTVTLPIPEGVSNPVVYYVSEDGATVTNMNATKDGNGNVTFETTHFSTYVIGESTEITVPDNETATGSGSTTTNEEKEVYVLVSTPTAGNQYILVSRNSAGTGYALKENTTTGTSITVNAAGNGISAPYIETTDETIMWNTASGMTFQSENGGYYLRYNDGLTFSTRNSTNWTVGDNSAYTYTSNRYRYVYNNNGTWTTSSSRNTSSDYNVYFYEKQTVEVETTTTVSGTYTIEGKDISVAVSNGSTASLKSTLTFTPDSGSATTTDTSTTATYEIVTVDANGVAVDGDPNDIISKIENGVVTFTGNYGTALVKVSYTTDFGVVTDYITVEATAPYYSIELHEAKLTEASITEFAEGVNYYTFNETTGFYELATEYVSGTTYYTTPVIQGEEITETVVLKGIEAGDTYAVWAVVEKHTSAGAEDMGALGDALHWTVSDTSIARIDEDTGVLTFTGTNYGTFQVTVSYEGDDGKVITDTITISATESLYVVPGDGTNDFPEYPNEGAVRFDKTATAVGNFSETGIAKVELSMTGVPYTTGNAIDALLVLDMSTSMKTEVEDGVTRYDVTADATKAFIKTIVQNDDGTYNNNTVAVHYFNGTTAYTDEITDGFITISSDAELEAVNDAIDALMADPPSTSGTDYSTSMEAAYDAIIARDAVSDNTQALVFMSDGGPTYYTYVNGDSYGTVSNSADTIVGWFDTDDNDTTDDETDDTATPNSSFKNEYYSTLLKNAGYPVYTVGLGLAENSTGPSAFTGLTSGAHEAITSYILSQMATNSSYFYNIADSDAVANMGNIFSGIAASIKEAATDVKVEDKIGNNYSMNFSLPTGITSDATDGLDEFYIQVVDYVLDSTTHERTGVYNVLENFTFNSDGSLKSHTVDGVECTDCTHVTTTNGTITKIEGTYFNYEVKADGEYLTWEAEKVTSTELALQYFAYLDNSAGTDVANQIPAGTYYTNEYATLTYTNFQGNQVQQEFPVPQMTWNGAQVSYVFYLVNAAGKPVNRAGREVPFAEAVYVTDVFTYSVIWNDMEQAAGLEAKYLAEQLVPEVYALYDDDASYNIHVYEKETEVNLNNHFVIGGDVDDEYNTVTNSWTNAKTTYVFNNKSDATKYNAVGTYVADDGDTNTGETGLSYFCKSAIIEGATYTTSVENNVTVYTVTSVGNGYQSVTGETQTTVAQIEAAGGSTTGGTIIGNYIYYVDENGEVYTIVTKTDGVEAEKGFDFSNTTVAFAVVWKPELVEDTVVVDYGLDVVIDVTTNDAMASGVVGVRTDKPDAETDGTYTRVEADTLTSVDVYINANHDYDNLKELKIGTATVENLTSVRFSLDEATGTQFSAPAEFYYEADVNYYKDNDLKTTSMYSKVTVIPATTVYYEDEYVTFTNSGSADEIYGTWTSVGAAMNKTQDVDRPDTSKISAAYDADNVYGYDSAYTTSSQYSMGGAKMVEVKQGVSGMASFSFYGTGFDVISMTDTTTGLIIVQVLDANGNTVKNVSVDTYYGYAYGDQDDDGEKEWYTVSDNSPNALYQVPVIKIEGLTYGKYTAKIVASYNRVSDHIDTDGSGSYTFYLDAIRIYDPTGNEDETAVNAYTADGEAYPTYQELRDNIIKANTFVYDADSFIIYTEAEIESFEEGTVYYTKGEDGTYTEVAGEYVDGTTYYTKGTTVNGLVFIDCNNAVTAIADYVSYGPNNELYLDKGQAIAFNYDVLETMEDVQLGIKAANGNTVTYEINGDSYTTNSTTELYYSILDYVKDGTVVIENVSGGILSLTNIKTTYKNETSATSLWMDGESAGFALMSLRPAAVEEETEATEPETTVPETTEPETTEPEVTEPETTEPETTEPEVTEPEEEESESVVETIVNIVSSIVNAISNFFSKWFR